MSSRELANLAMIGQLQPEAPVADEVTGLVRTGDAKLRDASNATLSLESRFDLAYNAAHAFALAALRSTGYRSKNRFTVFQALTHTLRAPAADVRMLAKCHGMRNEAEYEGVVNVDATLVAGLISAATSVRAALKARGIA